MQDNMIALIGKKIGMTQAFNERAELVPATAIHVVPNYVMHVRETDKDSRTVCLASIPTTQKHLSKAQQGIFTLHDIPFQRSMMEFVNFGVECNIGDALDLSLFTDIEYVDVIGWNKGKGYQGVVRRYGFGGGRASHGSKFHREVGSTGMAAYPAKTLKNTKMAGRMPVKRVTVQNLRIVNIDTKRHLILVRGAVPGPSGRKVVIRNAIKKMDYLR